MDYLLDTSVLARLANSADIDHAVAARSVVELHRRGDILHIAPQVLIEFRNVATRPQALNGLGLPTVEAEAQAAGFEATFAMLPESPGIYAAWKTIVTSLGVIGKQVHDARLAAICHVHGITHLLTFNVAHFTRMAACGPGLVIVDPVTV